MTSMKGKFRFQPCGGGLFSPADVDHEHLNRLHEGIRAWREKREKVHALHQQRHRECWATRIESDETNGCWWFTVDGSETHVTVQSRHPTLDTALAALLDWFYPDEAD